MAISQYYVDENVTIIIDDNNVAITPKQETTPSIPIKNINKLINVLQEIQRSKYDGW